MPESFSEPEFPEPAFHVGQGVMFRECLALVYGYIFLDDGTVLYDITPPDAENPRGFGDVKIQGQYYALEAALVALPEIQERL